MDDRVEFLLMGAFEVRRGNVVVDAGGGKRRALLAALLLSPNRVVSVDALRDQVWADPAPNSVANLIQGYVSDWRSLLSPQRSVRSSGGRLLSTSGGYLLRVDADECDVTRLDRLTREAGRAAAAGDLLEARERLRSAIGLRRGNALSSFGDLPLASAAKRIDDAWLSAVRTSADVELRLGDAAAAIELLEPVLAEWPLREDLVASAMTALYRTGRQTDALLLYDATRTRLADELGVDPEPGLRGLHRDILLQRRRLEGPSGLTSGAPAPVPAALSRFVGRERELAEVVERGLGNRLVTLVGLGGSGKTRLALQAAPQIAARGARALAVVDAAGLDEPAMLWSAAARALGRSLLGGPAPLDAFLLQLGEQRVLMVLDNMEHLLAAAPDLSRALARASQLAILATSRLPLGVEGEQLYPVGPLDVPGEDADPAEVMRAPATVLFVDRAGGADPAFAVDESDAPVLAGICRRLDGIPLAVELAAPWVRTLSLRALLEQLDRPFRLLIRPPSGTDAHRHASMQAVLRWSYDALPQRERLMLRHLAMFRSGAYLDAVTATWHEAHDAHQALDALVAANFVYRAGDAEQPRYRLLETVQAFVHDETAVVSDRSGNEAEHARFFCSLARRAALASGGPDTAATARRLFDEQVEIRAALAHLQTAGRARDALLLLVDCLGLWWDGGLISEGYRRLDESVAGEEPVDADGELLAAAHVVTSYLANAAGRPSAALAHERIAIDRSRQAGSVGLEIAALAAHGLSVSWTDWAGDAHAGVTLLSEAIAAVHAAALPPQRWGWSNASSSLAFATFGLIDVLRYRDPARARTLAFAVADDVTAIGDVHFAAFAARALGMLAADAGEWDTARRHLEESLELARRSGSVRSVARSRQELATLHLSLSELTPAYEHACAATYASRDAGHLLNWLRCAGLLAGCHAQLGELGAAVLVLDEAERAIGGRYPDLRTWSIAPRRAQLARINGDLPAAAHHLRTASALETASPLDPDRRLYLLEAAQLTGDRMRRRSLIETLVGAAARMGLAIPPVDLPTLRELGWHGVPEEFQKPLAR